MDHMFIIHVKRKDGTSDTLTYTPDREAAYAADVRVFLGLNHVDSVYFGPIGSIYNHAREGVTL